MGYPLDLRVFGQPLGDRQGVPAVAFHAQGEGFRAEQREKGVHRRHGSAKVSEADRVRMDREGEITERLAELQAVVGRLRLREARKTPGSQPVEAAAVHHGAADHRAVAGEELRRRVDDQIGAPLEGPAEPGGCERVVDDQQGARGSRQAGQGLQIGDHAARIRQALHEQRLGALSQDGLDRGEVLRIDEVAVPVELRERSAELRDRAAVEPGGCREPFAGLDQREEGQDLGGVSRGGAGRAAAALQAGNALLQRGDGRIAETGVDEAEGLEVEQGRRMVGVVERIRRGLVNRGLPCPRSWIRAGAGMDHSGLESPVGAGAALRGLGLVFAHDGGVYAAPRPLVTPRVRRPSPDAASGC